VTKVTAGRRYKQYKSAKEKDAALLKRHGHAELQKITAEIRKHQHVT
jgi:hypothetical protein